MTFINKKPKPLGKLAQQRAQDRAEEIPVLIWKAMDLLDGFTYPTLGKQLTLYVSAQGKGVISMSREVHAYHGQVTQLIMNLAEGGE